MATELEAQVDELVGRAAIADLVSGYCRGCDTFDRDLWASVFHADGEFPVGPPFGEPVGREQIKATLDAMRELYPEIRHYAANLVVTFEAPNLAHGESDALCEAVDRKGRHVLISASYRDRLERREDVWGIARREMTLNSVRQIPDPPAP